MFPGGKALAIANVGLSHHLIEQTTTQSQRWGGHPRPCSTASYAVAPKTSSSLRWSSRELLEGDQADYPGHWSRYGRRGAGVLIVLSQLYPLPRVADQLVQLSVAGLVVAVAGPPVAVTPVSDGIEK